MIHRARKLALKAQVEHRHEANYLLGEPGAAVLVHRGVTRSIAIACPDGCGEQLTVNLDQRAGPAWRYYADGSDVSIFPSVWRDTGCGSHFIVWRSKIYWCDWHDELDVPLAEIIQRVEALLPDDFVSFAVLADQLDLVPWSVLSACNVLVRRQLAEAGEGKLQGHYRRKRIR